MRRKKPRAASRAQDSFPRKFRTYKKDYIHGPNQVHDSYVAHTSSQVCADGKSLLTGRSNLDWKCKLCPGLLPPVGPELPTALAMASRYFVPNLLVSHGCLLDFNRIPFITSISTVLLAVRLSVRGSACLSMKQACEQPLPSHILKL